MPRWLSGLLAALALASFSDPAHADDWGSDGRELGEPAKRKQPVKEQHGWNVSTAVHTPLSLAILSEDDTNQALLLMTGLDVDVSVGGGFAGGRLAYELSGGVRTTLGVVDRFRVQPWEPQAPDSIQGHALYLLPLGLCLDWVPRAPSGWFGSVHLGVGTFHEPEYMRSGNLALAGRAAADVGWVLPLETGSLALSARYSILGLKRLYIDERYNSSLQSHDLSLGVAWNL